MEENRRFSDEEHEIMILAVAKGQGDFNLTDVEKLMEWILKVNIDKCFADMVLKGELYVDTRGKEFAFKKSKKMLERHIQLPERD
uniref:Uncharacterized protein n=1 Tax=viral metagenome TaxID=1070528 RepID=A0A6M3LRH4_9ZZZZ